MRPKVLETSSNQVHLKNLCHLAHLFLYTRTSRRYSWRHSHFWKEEGPARFLTSKAALHRWPSTQVTRGVYLAGTWQMSRIYCSPPIWMCWKYFVSSIRLKSPISLSNAGCLLRHLSPQQDHRQQGEALMHCTEPWDYTASWRSSPCIKHW